MINLFKGHLSIKKKLNDQIQGYILKFNEIKISFIFIFLTYIYKAKIIQKKSFFFRKNLTILLLFFNLRLLMV